MGIGRHCEKKHLKRRGVEIGYFYKVCGVRVMQFDEYTIRRIFGNEAAEDETPDRLEEYYVKTDTYEQMKSPNQLNILTGRKGVGKSALLKIIASEEKAKEQIPIFLLPDDILSIDINPGENFRATIRNWRNGLITQIFSKLLCSVSGDFSLRRLMTFITSFLHKQIRELQGGAFNVQEVINLLQQVEMRQKTITVFIDDLDRGWANSKEDVTNLSAMILAVRDLVKDLYGVRFRIALRSDVYYSVRTFDEATDKIESSVLWQKWFDFEILIMLVKRVQTYLNSNGRYGNEGLLMKQRLSELNNLLAPVLATNFAGKGHWANIPIHRALLTLTRRNPRDLVKLLTMAARKACIKKHAVIETDDILDILKDYSHNRLIDVANEYRCEFPDIGDFLSEMKPSKRANKFSRPCVYLKNELLQKIGNILEHKKYKDINGKLFDKEYMAEFLYKINFIIIKREYNGQIERIYYDDEPSALRGNLALNSLIEIHPAYRWALQPDKFEELFYQIGIIK